MIASIDPSLVLAAGGRGGGGPFFLIPLLLLALAGFFLFRLIRRSRPGSMAYGFSDGRAVASPMGVLGERFARGEIDREEFEYRRAVLNGDDEIPDAPA